MSVRFELRRVVVLLLVLIPFDVASAQEPIDLFSDTPKLSANFIRVGSWNLRHINLEGGAESYLPGHTEEEDFAILIATFAKAIDDLGLDVIALVEHQPRQGPDRLEQLRQKLNGGGGVLFRVAGMSSSRPASKSICVAIVGAKCR